MRGIQSESELQNGIALLEAYSSLMPMLSDVAGGLLIEACIRIGSLDQAFVLLRESRERRIRLTIRGIQGLMHALGEANRISDMVLAHSFLEKRGLDGYKPRALRIMVKWVHRPPPQCRVA